MHHPRSISSVRQFRLSAFMLLANGLLVPFAGVLMIVSLMTHDGGLTMIGAALVGLSMIMVIAQWSIASRTGCPLCRTPVLAPKTCMKHRKARTFMGSHRLRVALAILFKNRFRCPYCNEPTEMELRERLDRSHSRRSQLD